MAELIDHLQRSEDAIPYFYCDGVGLVTIAIGFLVDRPAGQDNVGKGLARALAQRQDVRFTRTRDAGVASTAEVESDWQRIKDHGRAHRGAGYRTYTDVSQLRIDNNSIRNITRTRPKFSQVFQAPGST
ncbi:MAG TPA: hypothetical protein VI299_29930, partial [Polyangiales bacterium]